MKLKTKIIIGVALALAGGGLATQAASADRPDQRPTVTMHAQWGFHPASLAQTRAAAQQIVLAEVVSAQPGEDIVTPAAGEPDGVSRIPTQRVTIRVVHPYKGTAKQGEQLVLFQTGGVVSTAKAGDTHPRMVLDGDPLYTKGQQYLLMLTSGPQGTLRVVSPEGRYRVDRSGALTPMIAGSVADEVRGKKLADLTF
ncbi:hypothetical protein M3G91_21460 [Micromonospora chalcea]|uniref:hypothetical protein n=1 Tax=Micromonospora chalcea TaxID=1874 RepID=UPI0021A5F300|nr:hypothetical protein [Micromonospora chalcea]MCT2280187.1 hypothetical protein [Micromonospora chalcea]